MSSGSPASTPELIAVLRECHDAVATLLDNEVLSAQRTQQLAEAEIKLRVAILALETPGNISNAEDTG